MTTHRLVALRLAAGLLSTSLLFVGCDDAPMLTDGGPADAEPPMSDAGPPDSGPADAGPADGGPLDGGPPELGPHSMITMYLASGSVTFPAVDGDGQGVVVSAGFARRDGSIYLAAGDQLHRFNPSSRTLDTPIPLYSADRMSTHTPDYMFAGRLLGVDRIGAIEGDMLRLWEFTPGDSGDPHFAASGELLQRPMATTEDDRPFAPVALDIAQYAGFDTFAATSDDRQSLNIETVVGSRTYFPVVAIETCSTNEPITADFVTMAAPQGSTGSNEPVLNIVSGNQVFSAEPGVLCFSDGRTLTQQEGAVIETPRVVFGANFDGSIDGSDEVLVVIEDAQ